MIQGIVGGTGDGKSLLATRYLTESLIYTDAFVVTNIPLVLGPLYEYVSKRRSHDAPAFDLDGDLKVLKDEDVFEFYRFRSGGLVLPASPDMEDGDEGTRRLAKPEFIARMKDNFARMLDSPAYQRPVHYFIDEAHNFFGSRDWKGNGRALLYYVSQHRHLHDEVYLITQVIDDVEKQFRDRILQTHQSRNQLRMRVGMFRAKQCFRVSVFNRLPGGNKRPMYSVEYNAKNLDADSVARCYRTVGALGIHSTPEAKPNKAIFSYRMLWAAGITGVLVAVAGLVSLPYLGGWIGKKTVGGLFPGGIRPSADKQSIPEKTGVAASSANPLPVVMPGLPLGHEAVPWLTGVWIETRNGSPIVHATVEGAPNEMPSRLVEAYNLSDYPSGWVQALGVRYYLKPSKVLPLPQVQKDEPPRSDAPLNAPSKALETVVALGRAIPPPETAPAVR